MNGEIVTAILLLDCERVQERGGEAVKDCSQSSVHASMIAVQCWEKRGLLLFISFLIIIPLVRRIQCLSPDLLFSAI